MVQITQADRRITTRRKTTKQIATLGNSPYEYYSSGLGVRSLLYSKDTLLRNNGYGYSARAIELYLDLLTDDQVFTSFDKQMTEIEARPWHIKPSVENNKARKIADFIKEVLQNLENYEPVDFNDITLGTTSVGYYDLLRTLGIGVVAGLSPLSMYFLKNAKNYFPILKPIDPARIQFELGKDGATIFPKLLTKRHSFHGIYLPSNSILMYRYWAYPNNDPYGYGLGRILFDPVKWREEGLIRWLNIIDKHSDPPRDGTYPKDATKEQIQNFKNSLVNMGTDGVLVKPEGFTVEYMTPGSDVDGLVNNFREVLSSNISKVITGEALTGEKEAVSTYVRDKVSESIRIVKARGWSRSFDSFLNRSLIPYVTELNFPGEEPPKLVTEWVDIEDHINLIQTLDNIGYDVQDEHIQEITDIPQQLKDAKKRKTFNFPQSTSSAS